MQSDASGERPGMGDGWVRFACDTDECPNSIVVRGEPPEGWTSRLREAPPEEPLHTRSRLDYCPEHASLGIA